MKTSLSGAGIGLRFQHLDRILEEKPKISWFEILVDNIMGDAREFYADLDRVREDYPFTFHGVSMNLGSVDPLDLNYLNEIKLLRKRYQPVYISDHLAWTGVNARFHHDLLPLPYTDESLKYMIERVKQAQDHLDCRLLIENPSSYFGFADTHINEWDFLSTVIKEADADILLDVNNIYVSAFNHRFDPMTYLQSIPLERVKYIHLAGYENCGSYLFDSHGEEVWPEVWALYQKTIDLMGPTPTLIEWDNDIPPLDKIVAEALKAQEILDGKTYELE